jgi:hypothetical protein
MLDLIRPGAMGLAIFGHRGTVVNFRLLSFPGLVIVLLAGAACSTRGPRVVANAEAPPWPWAVSPLVADSIHVEVLAPGVRLYRLTELSRPWRAAVLDVDLAQCVSVQSVKGASTAVGRQTTSALLKGLDPSRRAVGAVNADFFLFAPPGVPTGAHIERGTLISGPGARPVFAMDSAGRPYIGVLRVLGSVTWRGAEYPLTGWNRPAANSLSVLDAGWGASIDTAVLGVAWQLRPLGGVRYVVESATATPPTGDRLLLVRGRGASLAGFSVAVGDSLSVRWRMEPMYPKESVGGFPVLLRDSVMPDGAATAGAAGFSGPNPRTAVGVGAGGRRLLFVVIDGRQAGFSAGATLAQTADLMRALGAREALNLDGGGSSALVVRNFRDELRVITRPSDPAGERAVGNALAVLAACEGSRSAQRSR